MLSQNQTPTTPVITSVGHAPAGSTADSSMPVIAGTGDPGDIIMLYDGIRLLGTAIVGVNGTWTFSTTAVLKAGSHTFTALATDPATGAGSNSSATFASTIPSGTVVLPDPPSISGVTDNVGPTTGAVPKNGSTDDNHPAISGTGVAGDVVHVIDKGVEIGSTTVNPSGNWTFTPVTPLADGAHDITATQTNPATGATSNPSTDFPFKVDTTVPPVPTISGATDNVGPVVGPIPAHGTTDDNDPVIAGKGVPGDIVHVLDNGVDIGSTTVNPSGDWTFKPTVPLADGPHDITAEQSNPATGATSGPSQDFPFNVDTTTPVAPSITQVLDAVGAVTGPVPKNGSTDDNDPVISGKGTAGDIVHVMDNGKEIGSTTVSGTGDWSFKPATALADGAHDITATQANPATGKLSVPSGDWPFNVDTSAHAPVITDVQDAVGPVQGTVPNNGTTDDNQPTIKGTGTAGDTIWLYQNGAGCGSTIVDAAGNWSIKPAGALSDGKHDMTATQFASGQTHSGASNTWSITVDTSAPAAPSITQVLDSVGAITGPVAKNGTTDDNDPVISGKGVAGDVVHVMDNGKEIGSTTVSGTGDWSFKPATKLTDGAHDITATQANPATGKLSLPSGDWPFNVDTGAVPVPTISGVTDNVGPVTGPVAVNGTTDDNDPVIAGKGVAGDIVHVMDKGAEIGSTTVTPSGDWSFKPTIPLADGAHDITATQTNPTTGATSLPSGDFPFKVDTSVPPAPSIGSVTDNVGPIQGPVPAHGTTDDNDPVIAGKGVAGDVVHVMDNGKEIGSTTVDQGGNWTFKPTVPLADGAHDVTATQSNPATGATSGPSQDFPFNVDTTAPNPPRIVQVLDDVGAITGPVAKWGTTDDNDPVINGKGAPGAVVHVMDNDVEIGSTTVDGSGDWSFKPPVKLNDGTHDITATQANPATGKLSGESADWPFTVDTSVPVPVAPTITGVTDNVGPIQGLIPAHGTTDDNDPVITGKGVAGDVVHVMDKGVEIGSTTVTPSGDWSFKPTIPLADGAHDITATQTNPAGGATSLPSADFPFNVDTTAPAAPTITQVLDAVGAVTGPVAKNGSTDDNDPVISGKGVAGDVVHVMDKGVEIGSTTVTPSGDWSFKPAIPLADGAHDITATQANPATGKVSLPSGDWPFNVDTSVPAAPTISGVTDNVGPIQGPVPAHGTTDDNDPVIAGKGVAGDIVHVMDNGKEIGSTTVDQGGNWTFKPTVPLADGAHDITATQSNPATGATSGLSQDFPFNVDTSTPVAPSITQVLDAVGAVTGPVPKNGSTDDNDPVISGKGVAGDVVHVMDNGKEIGSTTVNGTGDWSFKPATPLADGAHDITATQANPATGKVSLPSGDWPFNVDTVPRPDAPVITVMAEYSSTGYPLGNFPSGSITPSPIVKFFGTADAKAVVYLYEGNTLIASTVADASGAWSYVNTNWATGPHDITATQKNTAGIESAHSNDWLFSVGNIPAPSETIVITNMIDHTLGNVSVGNNASTSDSSPTIQGTLSHALLAGETLVIIRDNQQVGIATASGTSWSFNDSGVSLGSHSYYAKVVGIAGNSEVSNFFYITEIAPAAVIPVETVVINNLTDHTSGANIPAGSSTTDTAPVVHGSVSSALLAGETLAVYRDGQKVGTATMSGTGWTFNDSGVRTGSHTYTAQVENTNGHGPVSNPFTFNEIAPAAPIPTETVAISSLTDHTSGANIPAGSSTTDTAPVVHGSVSSALLAGETLAVYRDGQKVGTATVSGTGWTFNDSGVGVGSHTYTAQVENSSGNGPRSGPFTFNELSNVPSAPVITDVQDAVGPVQGPVPNNGTTDDNQPTIRGTGTAGDTLWLFVDGKGAGETTVDGTGHWSIKPSTAMYDGKHSFTATQFASGQPQSGVSNTWTVTVDTAPHTPTETVVINNLTDHTSGANIPAGSSTTDTAPVVHGSVSSALLAGETLAVYRDGQKVGTATVSGTGWTFNDSGVGVGSHTYTAQVENSSGNGPRSGPFTFNELSNVPSAPVITDVQDAVGPVQGPVPNNGTTDDNQPTIRGTGTAGDTLWLFVDGKGAGETTVDGTGHWSIKPSTAMYDGTHSFTATQFASGQPQSGVSNTWTVTVDTAPHTPVETVAITNLVDDSSGSYVNVPSGGSTKDTSPIVQGTVSSALLTGETLVVYRDSVKVGTATVNGTSWSFNDSNVAVGDHTYTARVENSVGTGQYSAGYSFTEASASTHLQGISLDITGNVNPLYGSTYPNYIMQIRGAPVDSNNTPLIALLQVGDQSLRVNTNVGGKWYTGNNPTNQIEGIYYGSMGLNTVVTITAYGTTGTGSSQLINYKDVYTYSSTIGQILAAEVQYPYPSAVYDSPNYYHTYLTATGAKSTLPTVLSATHHDSSVDAQALAAAGTTDQPAATADQPHSVVGDHQAFTGTTGHDTVDLNVDPTVYFKEATAHIQGSTVHPADATSPTLAVNTLHLTGDHQILDLTSLTGKTAAAKISGIEVIDLGGHTNHLNLSLTDVLNLGEQDLFQKDGKQQMMVNGSDGDSVDLSNAHIAGVADGVWHQEGTAQVGGVTYNVYEHSGAHTELLIQQGVQIALHN